MSQRSAIYFGGIFFFIFLWLTPLGVFNTWVPANLHTGFYSVATIDRGDDTGYYAYLRSAFIDGDLDFFNERGYAHSDKINSTGYVFNNWQMGQAVLFFPFFLIGHGLAYLYQGLGYPITTDGYSPPYYISTAVASVSYLFAGLIFVYLTLRMFAEKNLSRLVMLSTWLASPLIYFSFIRQRMAHTSEFFLASILIFIWIRFRQFRNPIHYLVIGSVLGFLCMTRVINIAFFSLFFMDFFWEFQRQGKANPAEARKTFFILSAALVGGFMITMLPQLYAWYQLNGVPFPPRHMKFAGEGLADFNLRPLLENIYALFFSPKWGLFFSMPLAVLGIVGLFLKDNSFGSLRPGLLAYLIGIFGIILLYPEDSASYGQRHLISALPVFAIGLGLLFQRFSKNSFRKVYIGIWIFCLIAILEQFFMVFQYKVTLPYNHPAFTIKALLSVGDIVFEYPKYLIRSSSLFQILLAPHPGKWDYLDGMFLVLFPLFQLLALGSILLLFHKTFKNKLSYILNLKLVFSKIVLVSLFLLVLVAYAAPKKPEEEIASRLKYLETSQNGEAFFRDGQINAARVAYTKASQHMPNSWKPYFKIGQTWQSQGNFQEANKFLQMALNFNPKLSPALIILGNNYSRMGDLVGAEKMLRQAIQSWPMNKFAYDSLARVLAMQDKKELAIDMLKQAIRIDPNYGVGHANLAMVYLGINQDNKSLQHLNRAIDLGVRGPVIDRIKSIIERTAASD